MEKLYFPYQHLNQYSSPCSSKFTNEKKVIFIMQLKDLKKYRSYLPVKQERNEILFFINDLIGNGWINKFWFDKYGKDYVVRYRFGNKNITQIYLKNKKWYDIPVMIWIDLSLLNKNTLS